MLTAGVQSGLSLSLRAMQTAQFAMALHTKNIANQKDPNYTRQQMVGGLDAGLFGPPIARFRDMFIDDQYRTSAASAGEAGIRRDLMARVEDIFGDPLQSGLRKSLDRFFDSWRALSETPGDEVLRLEVLAAANEFAYQVRTSYTQLQQIEVRINEQIPQTVDQINAQLQAVKELNGRIAALQSTGLSDADLRDKRDAALDKLAELAGATSTELADGTVRVMIGAVPAVDGLTLTEVEVVDGPKGPQPKWVGLVAPEYYGGGTLNGLLTARKQDLDRVKNGLNTLAVKLAENVNAVHKTGYDKNGNLNNLNFFNIGNAGADIAVNPVLLADSSKLAAAGQPGLASDGTIAKQIADLANGALSAAPINEDEKYTPVNLFRNIVGWVGTRAKAVQDQSDLAKNHMKLNNEQRQSRWGVSVDEEVAMMTVQQKAFQAAVRVMNAMDEMLDHLINRM